MQNARLPFRPLRSATALAAFAIGLASLAASAQTPPAPASASPSAAAAAPSAAASPSQAAAPAAWTKATTVFVNTVIGSRTGGSARRISETHAEMEAKGWRFLDLEAYTENGDLVGFFVTYVK